MDNIWNTYSKKFWGNKQNRDNCIQWLGKKLNYNCYEDWYQIKSLYIANLNCKLPFNYCYQKAIMEYMPEHDWKEWLFGNVNRQFWGSIEHQKKYLLWLGHELKYKSYEDWYNLSSKILGQRHGWQLLNYYRDVNEIMNNLMPEYDWKEWKFLTAPKGFWKHTNNHIKYMRWLESQLGFKNKEDWYNVTKNDFNDNYGNALLNKYKFVLSKIVISSFPEYDLKEWMFKGGVPTNFWKDKNNIIRYMQWIELKLNITKDEEWFSLTKRNFLDNKGGSLIAYYFDGKYIKLIQFYKPHIEDDKFYKVGSKNQKKLFNYIKDFFPNEEILWNYGHPDLRFTESNYKMQLDIFIKNKNIAIEYQGEQHFKINTSWNTEDSLKKLQKRDKEKKIACKKNNIKLIEIDYKWSGTKESIYKILEETC